MNRHEIERATLVPGLQRYDYDAIRERARVERAKVIGTAVQRAWRALRGRRSPTR